MSLLLSALAAGLVVCVAALLACRWGRFSHVVRCRLFEWSFVVVGLMPFAVAAAWVVLPARTVAVASGGVSYSTPLLFVWVVGVGVALLPYVGGLVQLWLLGRRCSVAPSQIRERLDLRSCRLVVGSERDPLSPSTWGAFNPVVYLPAASRDWEADQVETALRHEAVHVRQLDWLKVTAARFLCALHWANPLAWVMLRQYRREVEHVCDERVVESGVQPTVYAEHLLAMARASRSHLGVALHSGGSLEARVRAVLYPSVCSLRVGPSLVVAGVSLVCLVGIVGAMQPVGVSVGAVHERFVVRPLDRPVLILPSRG